MTFRVGDLIQLSDGRWYRDEGRSGYTQEIDTGHKAYLTDNDRGQVVARVRVRKVSVVLTDLGSD